MATRKGNGHPGRGGHDPQLKATVLALLLEGQGVCEVARSQGLPHSVVSYWKARLPSDKLAEIDTKKSERISDLVFTYLATALETLTKQADFQGNEAYLNKQPGGELAVMHGVLADKVIRILEAHQLARSQSALPPPGSGPNQE